MIGMTNPMKTLTFPGDKSISHRLVLLSLLISKTLVITNLSSSKDVQTSLDIVKKLGVEVRCSDDGKTVVLSPLNRKDFGEEEIILDCGNSGTTARLLCGILANLKGRFKLVGDESLSKRPMERVVRPLADLMMVNIRSTDGHLPIYIEAKGKTKAADFFNKTGSAQVKSAVMFAGLAAEGETIVREQVLSRDHTERLLQVLRHCENQMLPHEWWGSCHTVTEGAAKQSFAEAWQSSNSAARLEFRVPGDISSAAYFIVLSLITKKSLKIENILLNSTRTGFLNVLKRMGADIEEQIKENDWEPIGDLIVKGGNLSASDITLEEIPSLIDELPILAVAMVFAEGKSRVSGASELRVKESDRISCLISQLKKVGINCSEFDDGYEIIGGNKIKPAELDSFGDHRLTMSFAVLARAAGADIVVRGRESAAVSFPEFYDYL